MPVVYEVTFISCTQKRANRPGLIQGLPTCPLALKDGDHFHTVFAREEVLRKSQDGAA